MTSKLYVTEYYSVASPQVGGLNAQVPSEPPLVEQTPIDYSGGHAESAAFNALTTLIRIHTDSICSVLIGTTPVATTGSARMVAGQTEYRSVPKGQNYKISVVGNT